MKQEKKNLKGTKGKTPECCFDPAKHIKCCPINNSLKHLGRKWSLEIIRDLFMGRNKFNQFLSSNEGLSTKVLSARLKDLQAEGFVEKKVISTTPLEIEYSLTSRGKALDRIIYELARFSITQYPNQVFKRNSVMKEDALKMSKKAFLSKS